jgi:conjugal transfer pilin signal peptidase TrbI
MNNAPHQPAVAIPAARPTHGRRILGCFGDFLRHARQRWYLYLPIVAIWSLAYVRLFIDATPRVPVLFNWTPSLPYRVAWLQHGPHQLQRGDFIVFSFAGEAQHRYPGLHGQPFFKIVRGLPGDSVTVSGRQVAINGEDVGAAKTKAYDRRPLAPIAPTVIPPRHYYVQGTSPDSFDSRYQESGLVRAEQVIGVVVPLF